MPIFTGGPGLWRRVRLILDPASIGALKRDAQKALREATDPRAANANLGLVARAVGFLRQQFVGMAAAAAAFFGARQVVRWADEWRLIGGRLELVTKDQEELVKVQEQLFQITQETRTEYEATAALFQRTALNAAQLGRTTDEILDLTKAVQQAIRVSGANQAEASAGVIQFSQALASGVLRGDEFRSVMENLPGLARAIAEGLGVTRGQLRAMAADGQLTADQVVGAVLKMKDRIEKDFRSVPLTVGQAFTVLGNSIMRFVGMADDASNTSSSLANSIVNLAQAIDQLSSSFAKVTGVGTSWMMQLREGAITLLSPVIDIVAGLTLAIMRFNEVAARVQGNKKLEAEFKATADAIQLFRVNMAERVRDNIFGGPEASKEAVQGMVQGFEDALGQLEQRAKEARDRMARDTVRAQRDAQLDALDEMIKRQQEAVAKAREQIQFTPIGDRRDLLRQQVANAELFLERLEDIRGSTESVGAAWIGLDQAIAMTLEELHKLEKERVSALVEARDLGIATAAENEELFRRAADYNGRLREGNLVLEERLRIAGLLNQIMEQLLDREVRERRTPRRAPLTDAQRQFLTMDQFLDRATTDAEADAEARRQAAEEARARRPGAMLVRGGKAPTLEQLGIVDPELARTEMDALKDHWFRTHEDLVEAGTNAAFGWANAWADAFQLLFEEGGNFRDFMKNVFKGLGAAAFGFLADFAGRKVKENIARGLEAIAGGFVNAVLYKDPTAIGQGIAASKMAFAAAAAWGVLGGAGAALQGAAGGSGRAGLSGGLPTGARDPAGRIADRLEPKGDIINIYVSGVDPGNPRHQELIGKAQQEWGGREGSRINVHKWNGD